MASRRDELNAYSFARKRMVGAFLLPSGGGNDEDAPRPLRAVLPSFVVGAVTLAAFGMWGVIKPAAPLNWDNGKNILQGTTSTTRYVVLPDGQLHQVLNMASARLVLGAGATVLPVADEVLDKYKNRGPIIGIQYAPDKLPLAADAGAAKKWSVCNRPGPDSVQATVNQAVFVAAGEDAKMLATPGKMLGDGQSLFVQAAPVGDQPKGSMYLIDPSGLKHAVGMLSTSDPERIALKSALFTSEAQPEQVTPDWLATVGDGKAITFPDIPGLGSQSQVQLSKDVDRKVGRLLKFQENSYFVVGLNNLYSVTPFMAQLIANDPALSKVYGSDQPTFDDLTSSDYSKLADRIDTTALKGGSDWPTTKPTVPVNNATPKDARTVVCSTFEGVDGANIKRTVWASTSYPATVPAGSTSAHVTAGHGLLFRSFDGAPGSDPSGTIYLITETGLRYALQANNDGATGAGATASPTPNPQQGGQPNGNEAQARLGFKDVQPLMVPSGWAHLVPGGPSLNTPAALQPQNV